MELAYVLIPLILTGSMIVLTGLLVVSYAADQAARRWRADKDIYRMVRSEIRRLKHILQSVTVLEWPIWPRPVLYESIDRQTQLAFAKAEEALSVIRRVDSTLRTVPIHSNLFSVIFHLPKNLDIWQNARHNLSLLQTLRDQQQVLSGYLRQIGRNQAEVARLQKQVEDDLRRFRLEYGKADAEYLGYLTDSNDPHFVEVSTIYSEMLACLDAADAAIAPPLPVDGKGYAMAHFWQQAAVLFQSSFDGACLVHTYTDSYILDTTQQRLDAILNTLRSLELPRQAEDWLAMSKAYRVIQHQKSAYAFVLKSIGDFETLHNNCLAYKKQLADLSLEDLAKQVAQAETELSEYLLPAQLPEFWQFLLQENAGPSQRIQQLQERLDAVKELCENRQILQSEISDKMAEIDAFIHLFNQEEKTIRQNVQAVFAAVQHQKEAEARVFQKLGPEGEATLALRSLDAVANSSSDEIVQKYLDLQSAYQQFHSRAAARQGANYSNLLLALSAFENECRALAEEQASGATRLMAQAAALDARLKALRAAAQTLQTRPPVVEGAWDDIYQQIAALEQQYQTAGDSYPLLYAYMQQAPAVLTWLEEEIEKINQAHMGFVAARLNFNNRLSSAKKALDSQIDTLSSTWPKPMRDLLNELKAYKNQYAMLRKAFLRLSDIKTMAAALEALGSLDRQLQLVEAQVKDKNDLSIRQQKQLNDFVKQINTIIQNAESLNIDIARVESAREIMEAAREKETFADAFTLLKWAVSILQSGDLTTKQPPGPSDRGQGKLNRPGSNRMITSDYKQDVPPENKPDS